MPQQQAFEPGALLRVDLDEQWHSYARMLARPSMIAFYDGRASTPVTDADDIVPVSYTHLTLPTIYSV